MRRDRTHIYLLVWFRRDAFDGLLGSLNYPSGKLPKTLQSHLPFTWWPPPKHPNFSSIHPLHSFLISWRWAFSIFYFFFEQFQLPPHTSTQDLTNTMTHLDYNSAPATCTTTYSLWLTSMTNRLYFFDTAWCSKRFTKPHIHTSMGGCCHAERILVTWSKLGFSVLLKDILTWSQGLRFEL